MSYVACIYDAKWWVGLVEEVDKCNNEILVNFMHPFGPSKTFIWPQREDKCYVNLSSILKILDSPATATGQTYFFSVKNIEDVKHNYSAAISN